MALTDLSEAELAWARLVIGDPKQEARRALAFGAALFNRPGGHKAYDVKPETKDADYADWYD